jgi:hypothetical protein
MEKKTFENFIKLSIDKGKKEKSIYDNGLDLINFMDDYSSINNILLRSIYGETSDIISDFIFDSVYDELENNKSNYVIYDDKDEIIADCSTLNNLYNYVESVRLELISEGFSYKMKEPMSEEERMNLIKGLFS